MTTSNTSQRSTTFSHKLWILHRWLGLGAGLIILSFGISGALLLLEDELKATVEAREHHISAPGAETDPVPLNPVLAELEKQNPGLTVSVVYWPEEKTRAVQVVLRDAERKNMRLATINPWTAEIISTKPRIDSLHYWALQLHYKLLLGKTGMILTSLGAIALTLLALTGLWLNRRVLRTLTKPPMRLGRGLRIAWSDLHKWSGTVSLLWVFLLGVTGIIYMVLILPGEFRSHAGHQHGAPCDAKIAWTQLPDLGLLRKNAKAALPNYEFDQLVFPSGRSPGFSANMLDRSAWWWNKRGVVVLDSKTGIVLKSLSGVQRTAKDRALSALAGLHFGTLGAAWVKWLYLFLGAMAPGLLSVSGAIIWFVRTRKLAVSKRTETSAS